MSDYHDWQGKLKEGKEHEGVLDKYFLTKDFLIEGVDLEQDKKGVDRIFISPKSGQRFTMQYKADSVATRTGNICIETVSTDMPNVKPGWAHTTQADYLAYYLPLEGVIYLCKFADIRSQMARWAKTCKRGLSPNDGCYTVNILVPRAEFLRVVLHTFYIDGRNERRAA